MERVVAVVNGRHVRASEHDRAVGVHQASRMTLREKTGHDKEPREADREGPVRAADSDDSQVGMARHLTFAGNYRDVPSSLEIARYQLCQLPLHPPDRADVL